MMLANNGEPCIEAGVVSVFSPPTFTIISIHAIGNRTHFKNFRIV